MNFKKKFAAVGLSVLMASTVLTGCGSKIDGTQTACTVDDETISLGEIAFYARYEQAMMFATYSSMFGAPGELFSTATDSGSTIGDDLITDAVDTLVKGTVVMQHASDYDVSLTADEEAEIERIAQAYIDGNDENVRSKVGASKEDVLSVLKKLTFKSKMREPVTADMDTEVSDEEAAQTKITLCRIKTNQDETPEDALANAQSILEALQKEKDIAGTDIETIAKAVDENASVTTSTFSTNDPSDSVLNTVIIDAVKGLTAGELTKDVIDDADAHSYVIARVDTLHDDEATANKVTSILKTRRADLFNEITDSWVENGNVVKQDKVIASLKITDSDLYTMKEE